MKYLQLKSTRGKFLPLIVISSFLFVAFTSIQQLQSPTNQIPYPEGYKEWTHIKTALTGLTNNPQTRFDGFHHIYADEKAMVGYKSGKFPEGAVIVFDKHERDTLAGVIQPGRRKWINVMVKNSEAFKDTGGWGYEEFNGDSKTEGRLTMARVGVCFNCHKSKSGKDFVFTELSE